MSVIVVVIKLTTNLISFVKIQKNILLLGQDLFYTFNFLNVALF